jgi:hypothetical protein
VGKICFIPRYEWHSVHERGSGDNRIGQAHFPFHSNSSNLLCMSTISAILDPHPDGSLHLPLPPELRHRRVRVEASLEVAEEPPGALPLATPEMLRVRKEALAALRELGGLRDVIPDPVAWQREQREDRSLPGRD